MGEPVKTMLVQLGEPLAFDLPAGLVNYPAGSGLDSSIRSTVANLNRCAVSRPLSGSWVVRFDVVTTSASSSDIALGVIMAQARDTLAERRPVNDFVLTEPGLQVSNAPFKSAAIRKNGQVFRNGTLTGSTGPTFTTNSKVWMIYDAAKQELTWRVGNPYSGGFTEIKVEGPLRIALNCWGLNTEVIVVHDVGSIARLAGYRPAGVWGRLSDTGLTDKTSGVVWDGRIPDDAQPSFEQSITHPIMGGRAGGGVGDITAMNTRATRLPFLYGQLFRALDDWLVWDVRDEPCTIRVGKVGFDLYGYTLAASGRVDSISESGEDRIAITLRDESARLDVPWQAEVFPTAAGILPAVSGKTIPTIVGACKAAPLVASELGWSGWRASDEPIQTVEAVYDRGVAITAGVGYELTSPRTGIKRLTNPDGLQCMDANAGWIDDTVLVGATIGEFLLRPWAGLPAAPPGWVNASSGGGTVTKVAGGARFLRAGAGVAELRINGALPGTADLLRIDIDVVAGASGVLIVYIATGISAFPIMSIPIGSPGSGVHSTIRAGLVGRPDLVFSVISTADITLRSITVTKVHGVSTLADHVRYAASYRGPLAGVGASVAAFSGPLSAVPLCYATPMGDRSTVRAAIDRMCASAMAGAYFDLHGALQVARFRDPAGESPVHTFDETNIIGPVRITIDRAPGLASQAAGVPTWAVHADQDIAGSLYTTDPGRTLAGALTSEYQATRSTAAQLASMYDFARAAEPIPTLLAAEAGVQAFANEVGAIYSKPRRLYQIEAAAYAVPIVGDCVALDYAGVTTNLIVTSVRSTFAGNTFDLTLWG